MIKPEERCVVDECPYKIWFTDQGLCRDHGLAVGADWIPPTSDAAQPDEADTAVPDEATPDVDASANPEE